MNILNGYAFRHLLLKMQKEMRTCSANLKRNDQEANQKERHLANQRISESMGRLDDSYVA